MPILNMLIKPVSGSCNLRCKYCFYTDVALNREQASYGKMSLDTLETLIQKALEYANQSCTFAFQGGEPTLAGLDFYKKAVEFQKKYNFKNLKIQNTIQTNGTRINADWASFFQKENFLVGLSLDGSQNVHDLMRTDASGNGTFHTVLETAKLLQKMQVDFNILCVITRHAAQKAKQIYHFFQKCGFSYIQPIPCLDPLGEAPGEHSYSLTPECYAAFLKDWFDLWYQDIQAGKMSVIRIFDNYLGILLGCRPELCSMMGNCICQHVIEADGSVYPCDFYVLDEWRLGNIQNQTFEELEQSPKCREFIRLSLRQAPKCRKCEWKDLCRGGCRRNREPLTDEGPSLNSLCPAYEDFLAYAYPRLVQLKNQFLKNQFLKK